MPSGYGGPNILPGEASVRINGGETSTTARAVVLHLFCLKAGRMRIADGSDASLGDWEDFAATKDWVLPAGDGTKTISVEFQPFAGTGSATASTSIVLDEDGTPSTLRELMIDCVRHTVEDVDGVGEAWEYHDVSEGTATACVGIFSEGAITWEFGATGGKDESHAGTLVLPYTVCPTPALNDYLVKTSDGQRWNIDSIVSNDRMTAIELQIMRRFKAEATGDGFRRSK